MKWSLIKLSFLVSFFISFELTAQDTTLGHQSIHKKNIFTLGLYKQPGLDSMVDFVDGLYRILKVNKIRSQDTTQNKTLITFIPAPEYSLATGFATSLNADIIFPTKNSTDNHSSVSSTLKYTQNKQVITQLVSNFWMKNNSFKITTDWNYLKFPQKDFGLGSGSNLKLFNNLDYSYIKMHQSIVKELPLIYILDRA